MFFAKIPAIVLCVLGALIAIAAEMVAAIWLVNQLAEGMIR